MDKKQTILIVESELNNRKMLSTILEENYYVIEVEDGETAWEFLSKNQCDIDAIITDISLPVMDGYALIERIKENSMNEIPIIVTTYKSDVETEQKALEIGAWDFVTKPYNEEILLCRLHNALIRRQVAVYERLQSSLSHDSLSGLYRRSTMFEKTRELIDNHSDKNFAFIKLDIDHFGIYNASFGEEEGNKLLKFFAQCIKESVSDLELATYCRMNSDIFCVCVECNNTDHLIRRINRVQTKFNEYRKDYQINISAGICFIDEHDLSIDELYFRASIAADQCKNMADTSYSFYDTELGLEIAKEFEIASEMQNAINEQQFVIFLQPKIDLKTEMACGAEALVRWNHPKKGMLYPGEFIPTFEKNGFISKLDYYVWEHTCMILKELSSNNELIYPISVNVSRVSLYNPNLTELITQLVDRYNIDSSLLQLEITESAYMTNESLMQDTLHKLRNAGFTILMDDFGSGYSSLNILKDIEMDILKIDMKFLPVGDEVGKCGIILSSIIKMAKRLGMVVIIEGVETKKQRDFIEGAGCSYVQGYYYSKPLPLDEYIDKYIKNRLQQKEMLLSKTNNAPSQSETILIVENIEADRDVLNSIFNDEYNTELLSNAESALAYLKKNYSNVKLILLNNSLHSMNGVEILDFCRHDNCLKNIPIIIISSSDSDEDHIMAFKKGAYDYIVKPFKKEIVRARVNHVIGLKDNIYSYDEIHNNKNNYLKYDESTNLLNKYSFNELACRYVESFPEDDSAFFIIDIDDFKHINDNFGHLVGDKVIKAVASVIKNSLRSTDIIGRFGGDEFIIVMTKIVNRKSAKVKANEIIQSIYLTCKEELNINVGLSIGISFYESDDSVDAVFARADQALYDAKKSGKNMVAVFGEKVPPVLNDEKPVVLVCGDDPQLFPAIALAYGDRAAFSNVTSYDELVYSFNKYKNRIAVVCLDMQKNVLNSSDRFYQYLLSQGGGKTIPIVAVCQEGDLSQIEYALKLDIMDIISLPPQMDVIGRRISNAIMCYNSKKKKYDSIKICNGDSIKNSI